MSPDAAHEKNSSASLPLTQTAPITTNDRNPQKIFFALLVTFCPIIFRDQISKRSMIGDQPQQGVYLLSIGLLDRLEEIVLSALCAVAD